MFTPAGARFRVEASFIENQLNQMRVGQQARSGTTPFPS